METTNYIYLAALIACQIYMQACSIEAKRFNSRHLSSFGDYYVDVVNLNPKEQEYRVCLATCRNESTELPSLTCGMGANPTNGPKKRRLRVIGGRDAKPGEFPYNVAIITDRGGKTGPSICGGVIIDEQYILSAAHCFYNCDTKQKVAPKNLYIRIGEHKLDTQGDGEKLMSISKLHIHPDFEACSQKDPDKADSPNDLAILKVSERMKLELTETGYGSVNSICLPASYKYYKAGQVAIITGWGLVGSPSSNATMASILQVAKLEFDDIQHCRQIWGNQSYEIDERLQVCAHKPGGKEHSCYGDSGGALAVMNEDGKLELAGIVSFGDRNCQNTKPAVYTRISEFLDWIEPLRLGRSHSSFNLNW